MDRSIPTQKVMRSKNIHRTSLRNNFSLIIGRIMRLTIKRTKIMKATKVNKVVAMDQSHKVRNKNCSNPMNIKLTLSALINFH